MIKPWKFILWDHVKVIFVLSGSNGGHRFIVITFKFEIILNPFIVLYIGIRIEQLLYTVGVMFYPHLL